jgi:hypothetical protein
MKFMEKMAELQEMRKEYEEVLAKLAQTRCTDPWVEAMERAGRLWDNATDPRFRRVHAVFLASCVVKLSEREQRVTPGSRLDVLVREAVKEAKDKDAGAIAPLDPEFEVITPADLIEGKPAKGLPNR